MKILIVDDNEELAENLGELLEDEGHQVALEASSAPAERLCARACEFDLALLDICLGKEDGVDLAARLQAVYPTIRVALMTAYTDESHRARALAVGPVLAKPVPLDDLLSLLQ